MDLEKRLSELQSSLVDLQKRWPAHSVKPQMIDEMERIEEEIAILTQLLNESKKNDQT